MRLITRLGSDPDLRGLIDAALAEAQAAVITISYEVRLTLAAGYALTVLIGREPHIRRVEEVVLEPAVRRHAAYCLHRKWASCGKNRRAHFPQLKSDLERLDARFSDLKPDQVATK